MDDLQERVNELIKIEDALRSRIESLETELHESEAKNDLIIFHLSRIVADYSRVKKI